MSSGTLALLAAVCCWGLAVPLSKSLLTDLDPDTMICVQLGASVVLLAATALVTRTRLRLPSRASLLTVAAIGTLEPGVAYYLEFVGLRHTTALHASLILTLEPVGILVLNVLIFQFRRDIQLLLSAIGASIGVLIVVLGSGGGGGASSLHGDTIIFLGTMAASLYVSLSTQWFKSESVLSLLLMQQASSLAFALIVGALHGMFSQHGPAHTVGPALLGAAAGVGILQFTLAFFFYFHGVRKSSGYWSVVVLNFAPVIGIAASVILLGEKPNLLYLVGGAMSLGSSLYTRLREHALDSRTAPNGSECRA